MALAEGSLIKEETKAREWIKIELICIKRGLIQVMFHILITQADVLFWAWLGLASSGFRSSGHLRVHNSSFTSKASQAFWRHQSAQSIFWQFSGPDVTSKGRSGH